MVRLQIQLEPERHKQVKRRAKRLGISVSEVIRRCIGAQLQADAEDEPATRARRAVAAAGKYRDPDGPGDVAARHDDVLSVAYSSSRRGAAPGR